jgi:hypothetical protein
MECPGAQSNPAKPMCAGGSQGLYCNLNKEVEVRAPSSKPPTNYQKVLSPSLFAVPALPGNSSRVMIIRVFGRM